jgi:hypothetical protein
VKELTLVAEALEASKSVLGFLDGRQRGGWRYPDEVNSSIEIDVALQAGYRPSGLSRIGMRTQRGNPVPQNVSHSTGAGLGRRMRL